MLLVIARAGINFDVARETYNDVLSKHLTSFMENRRLSNARKVTTQTPVRKTLCPTSKKHLLLCTISKKCVRSNSKQGSCNVCQDLVHLKCIFLFFSSRS